MTDIGRRGEHREPMDIWGSYRNGRGKSRDVHLRDLTLQGCRFYDKFGSLDAGTTIVMWIDTFGPLAALVRWSDAAQVGVEFRDPLHVAVFDHLKEKQKDSAANTLGRELSKW